MSALVKHLRWWLGWAALLAVAVRLGPAASSAQAAAVAPVSMAASVGFDGYYREGGWLPVRVLVENNGPSLTGQLELSTPPGYNGGASRVTRTLDLPSQSRRELFLYIAPEGYAGAATLTLTSKGQDLAAPLSLPLHQLTSSDLLYGVLAGTPSAYSFLANADPASGQAYVTAVDVAALPPLPQGWEPLDILVVSDVDTGALSPEQRAALSAWVEAGGRLMVMGGPSWQKTAAGLGALLPVQPAGTRTAGDWAALSDYAGAAAPADSAVAATGGLASDARWLTGADWVALREPGYGQVFYLAVDPAFAPLRAWDGTLGLFQRLLATPGLRPGWSINVNNWSAAQNAVDALPDLQLPSPFLICGFLGLYLGLVGPLNYLLLRVLKRRELAWVTIPAIVLVFSLAAYLVGYGLAGNTPTLHLLTVVQAQAGQAEARLSQLIGVYSPRRTTYDVEFAPGWLARALPGGTTAVQVEQGDQTRLVGVRTEIAAVQTFLADGRQPAPDFAADLHFELGT